MFSGAPAGFFANLRLPTISVGGGAALGALLRRAVPPAPLSGAGRDGSGSQTLSRTW